MSAPITPWRQRFNRSGVLVCQTLFITLVLTCALVFSGVIATRLGVAALGGLLLFNASLLYSRVLAELGLERTLAKFALAMLCAFVAGSGIAAAPNPVGPWV